MNKKILAEAKGTKSYIVLQALCKWAALLAQILVVYSIATISELALEGYGVDKIVLAKRVVYIIFAILIIFVMNRACVVLSTKASDKTKKKLLLRIAQRIQEIESDPDSAANEYINTEKTESGNILTDIIQKLQKIDSYLGGYCPQLIYTILASITVAGVLFTTNIIPAAFILLAVIFLPIVIQMAYLGVGRMISDMLSYVGFIAGMIIALELYAADKITVTGGMMIALLSWEVFAALRPLARMSIETIDFKETAKGIYLFLGEVTLEEIEGDEEEEEEEDEEEEDEEEDGIKDANGSESQQVEGELKKSNSVEEKLSEEINNSEDSEETQDEDPFEIIAGGANLKSEEGSEAETTVLTEEKKELTSSDLEEMLAEVRQELGIKSIKDEKRKNSKTEDKESDTSDENNDEFADGIDITNNKQNGAKQIGEFIKTILTPAVLLMAFAGVLEILAGVLGVSDLIGENYQPWFYTILIALVVVSTAINEIASHVKKVNPDGVVRTQMATVIAIFMTVFIGRYSMLTAMILLLGCYLIAGLIPYLDVRRKKLPLKKAAESQTELEKALSNLTSEELEEDTSEKEETFVEEEKPANGLEIEDGEQIEKDVYAIRLNTVSYKYDHLRRDLEGVQKKEADRRSFAGMVSTLAILIILLISVWQVGYGALRPIEYMMVISGAYFALKILKNR